MRRLSGEEFAVLPDGAAGQAVAGALGGAVVLDYPSGRPCLLAASPHEVVRAQAGRARLAVIGTCPVTTGRLRELAARLRRLEDADAVAAALPGSFHLVAAVDGRVRVQGTASGTRRVYFAWTRGRDVIVSNRAAFLGDLTAAGVDEAALATRLLAMVPPALATPLWDGVSMVPPGDAAHIDAHGVRLRTWWRAPEPEVPLAEGAPALAAALYAAVGARVGEGAVVAGDLSCGLDSAPVAFLAAAAAERQGAKLVTFEPGQDDAEWSALARAHLAGEHVVAGPDDLPGWFAEVAEIVPGLDEPMRWLRVLDRELAGAALLAERGAAVRLTGHGGDEVTLLPAGYLHGLARRHPVALWPHLRERRARARWPLQDCLRALADRRPYARWLRDQAGLLTQPLPPACLPDFGWEPPLRLPAWATPAVADAVRGRLGCAARPYSPVRAQHQVLSNSRATAAVLGDLRALTAGAGAAVHAPFLDDHVIAACLAVRLDERAAAPGAYKPLMVAAMRGVMPPECLRRATKGEFSADFHRGLRRHRDQLLALLDGSLLVERGLADAAALRRACLHAPPGPGPSMLSLDVFVAAENWLRAQQSS